MRPTEIPDGEIWSGSKRIRVEGFGDVADVQALVDESRAGVLDGAARFNIRLELEDGDLEKLAAGGVVWLSLYGNVLPFSVDVAGPVNALTREDAADLLIQHGRGLRKARAALLAGDHGAIDQLHRAAIRNAQGRDGDPGLDELGRAADLLHSPRRTA